jgi:hypothetical protein
MLTPEGFIDLIIVFVNLVTAVIELVTTLGRFFS